MPPALAARLVERGHDAVHAAGLGLDRAADTEIMSRARAELEREGDQPSAGGNSRDVVGRGYRAKHYCCRSRSGTPATIASWVGLIGGLFRARRAAADRAG